MPRRQRLVRERAKRLAAEIEDNPRTKQKKSKRELKNAFQGHVRDIARAYTEVAMAELIKLMTKSKSENMRLLSASAVLERGWGKPAQTHVGGDASENPIRHVHEVKRTIIDPKKKE